MKCFLFIVLERISPGLHVNIDLFPPVANEHGKLEHRYSMTAVDIPKKSAKSGVFAIFIVPQGTTLVVRSNFIPNLPANMNTECMIVCRLLLFNAREHEASSFIWC